MIRHPYVHRGFLDHEAHDAAKDRALVYGSAGFLDPRTYTLDPYLMHKAGLGWRAAFATSARVATVVAPMVAATAYLRDPLDTEPVEFSVRHFMM